MMVHTITNYMLGYFVRKCGYRDHSGGFGHIDLSDFDCTKEFHVVVRVVDTFDDTYEISVVGSFDSLSAALDDIDIRSEYRIDSSRDCYAEYEVWYFQLFRYRWYYGGERFDSEELPYYLCSVLVLDEPELSECFDDPSEWGAYTGLLLNGGRYILVDVTVPVVEITYLDYLSEKVLLKRITKSVPCATHILKRN